MIGANNDKKHTVKDMSDSFTEQISVYQMQIDEFWQKTVMDPYQIVFVNERMHQLFKKLNPKMDSLETKRQFIYEKKLQEVRSGMFSIKKVLSEHDLKIVQHKSINEAAYCKYKYLLEKRELELNAILEKIGLTAKHVEVKKRLH